MKIDDFRSCNCNYACSISVVRGRCSCDFDMFVEVAGVELVAVIIISNFGGSCS